MSIFLARVKTSTPSHYHNVHLGSMGIHLSACLTRILPVIRDVVEDLSGLFKHSAIVGNGSLAKVAPWISSDRYEHRENVPVRLGTI